MTFVAIVVALIVVVASVGLFVARGRMANQLRGPTPIVPRPSPPPVVGARLPAPKLPSPGHPPRAVAEPRRPPPVAPFQSPAVPPSVATPSTPSAADVHPIGSIDIVVDQSVPPPRAELTETSPSEPPKAPRDVAGLRKGLAATRGGFIAKLTALLKGKKDVDPALLQEVEEVMLASDVGPKTTAVLVQRLREAVDKHRLADTDAVWSALRSEAAKILAVGGGPIRMTARPTVVLMVGVNGVGKTTTIGKLATRYIGTGKKVVLAAGDTFRAAAVQQLEAWGKRVGAGVVKGKDGADPGAVAFDAAVVARETACDLLLVDTAGRLHTKAPLMDEIRKIRKTIAKAIDGAPHEVLLVLDATTGQNALAQAAIFKEALDLTGIVLTKLDGTAKGGIVLGICDELKVPVRYIGLGERAEDLREFDADDFVEALFGKGDEEVAAA